MRSTPLIPLARTTTGLDSIRTKMATTGKEGLSTRIHALVAKLTTIMELRTHQSYEAKGMTRSLKLGCLSVNYLGVRVSMSGNVV